MKSFKLFAEEMTFKVEVEGLPAMYVNGNSPGQVKNHLRKLVKQPSMIKSVKRQTKHDVKKMYRDKAQGKNVEEAIKYTHVAVDKKGKVAGMASKASDAKDMARRHGGKHHQLKKPMHPKVGDMMINKSYNPVLTKEMTQQDKNLPNLKVAVGTSAQKAKDAAERSAKRKNNRKGTHLAAQYESKDMPPREYDYEGEMTKQQLRTIEMASKELQGMISDDQNLPEWWQNKVTLAADYMQTARDYLKSDVKEGTVDYGTDKSIEIMKKKTPGETQEGNGLWANIHAKRKRGEKMRKKGEKGAPTPAAIKSAQKEDVTEKITIGKIRRAAYKTGKALGDVQAVKKNKVARRVKNRIVGKLAAKALSGLFK